MEQTIEQIKKDNVQRDQMIRPDPRIDKLQELHQKLQEQLNAVIMRAQLMLDYHESSANDIVFFMSSTSDLADTGNFRAKLTRKFDSFARVSRMLSLISDSKVTEIISVFRQAEIRPDEQSQARYFETSTGSMAIQSLVDCLEIHQIGLKELQLADKAGQTNQVAKKVTHILFTL